MLTNTQPRIATLETLFNIKLFALTCDAMSANSQTPPSEWQALLDESYALRQTVPASFTNEVSSKLVLDALDAVCDQCCEKLMRCFQDTPPSNETDAKVFKHFIDGCSKLPKQYWLKHIESLKAALNGGGAIPPELNILVDALKMNARSSAIQDKLRSSSSNLSEAHDNAKTFIRESTTLLERVERVFDDDQWELLDTTKDRLIKVVHDCTMARLETLSLERPLATEMAAVVLPVQSDARYRLTMVI